jgi:hypothetical protein
VLEGVLRDLPDARARSTRWRPRPWRTCARSRHRPAIWAIGSLTLVDTGSLLEEAKTCAVILDGPGGSIAPIGLGPEGVKHWYQVPVFQA